MRAVRITFALLIVSTIVMLALSDSRFSPQPFAQVTAAPGPVPLTAPAAPGQPRAFSTIGALPALAPAPGTGSPPRRPRCRRRESFDAPARHPATWTEWAGSRLLVELHSRAPVRARAVRQLLAELEPAVARTYRRRETASRAQQPQIYNGTAFTQRAQVQTSVDKTCSSSARAYRSSSGQCARCACN